MNKTLSLLLSAGMLVASSFGAVANDNICSYLGCPSGAPSNNNVIERQIYVLSNNRTTKLADWIAYKVTPDTIDGPSRSRSWRADPSISSRYTLEPDDYRDANAVIGTDRGHQVPLASFSNTPYWRETNYLSNITPQASNLNQGPWVKLENAVREHVRTGESVYVITGPLYEYFFAELPRANERHTVPSGYFKVVMTISRSGWIEASGFIMEQDAGRRDNFCATEVTIDEVERRTGLNLLPAMPSYIERSVERRLGGMTYEMGC
jgi:endonuclease G